MKIDKYVLVISNENGETTLKIKDYLTGTTIEFTEKELGASDGLSIGWMCKKLIESTKGKYRRIAETTPIL